MSVTVTSIEELIKAISGEAEESLPVKHLILEVPINQSQFEQLADSNLGKGLEVLEFRPEYDDSNPPVIDTSKTSFPSLKDLDLNCQAIKAFHFTKEFFPKLASVSLESPCAMDLEYFTSDLPKLKSLSFRFVCFKDLNNFGPSVSKSILLESIHCYKFWGLSSRKEHTLVLPNLETLDLYRSDDMRVLKLWTPKLSSLNLQACYACTGIKLLKRLPAGYKKQDGYTFSGEESSFGVNIVNCSHLRKAQFDREPRVSDVETNEEEFDGQNDCVIA